MQPQMSAAPPDPALALAVFAVAALAAAVLFWPVRGLVSRWRRGRRLTGRVRAEDALKYIAKREIAGGPPHLEAVAGALGVSTAAAAKLLERLEAVGLATASPDGFRLTDEGREVAMQVVRAHRLWERYLSEETGYREREWHDLAEVREHELDAAQTDDLSSRLGDPPFDPHGDPIPDASGRLKPHGGRPLTSIPAGSSARIVHIEDEPDNVYRVLVELGLHPGQVVTVESRSADHITLRADGEMSVLAPIASANLSVIPIADEGLEAAEAEAATVSGTVRLSELRLGDRAVVVAISPRCRGVERRRLMDLGILPGTPIEAELDSPPGDPRAYRVRGALIALRLETTDYIRVRALGDGEEAA